MCNKLNNEEVKNNAPLSDAELEGVAGGQGVPMSNESYSALGSSAVVTGSAATTGSAANQTGFVSTMGVTAPDEANKRTKPDIQHY